MGMEEQRLGGVRSVLHGWICCEVSSRSALLLLVNALSSARVLLGSRRSALAGVSSATRCRASSSASSVSGRRVAAARCSLLPLRGPRCAACSHDPAPPRRSTHSATPSERHLISGQARGRNGRLECSCSCTGEGEREVRLDESETPR